MLLGVHVVVPKGAISIKKVGSDSLDRCGQFVEQCSRLQVSTVLWYPAALERRQSAVCSKSSLSASLISSSVINQPRQPPVAERTSTMATMINTVVIVRSE